MSTIHSTNPRYINSNTEYPNFFRSSNHDFNHEALEVDHNNSSSPHIINRNRQQVHEGKLKHQQEHHPFQTNSSFRASVRNNNNNSKQRLTTHQQNGSGNNSETGVNLFVRNQIETSSKNTIDNNNGMSGGMPNNPTNITNFHSQSKKYPPNPQQAQRETKLSIHLPPPPSTATTNHMMNNQTINSQFSQNNGGCGGKDNFDNQTCVTANTSYFNLKEWVDEDEDEIMQENELKQQRIMAKENIRRWRERAAYKIFPHGDVAAPGKPLKSNKSGEAEREERSKTEEDEQLEIPFEKRETWPVKAIKVKTFWGNSSSKFKAFLKKFSTYSWNFGLFLLVLFHVISPILFITVPPFISFHKLNKFILNFEYNKSLHQLNSKGGAPEVLKQNFTQKNHGGPLNFKDSLFDFLKKRGEKSGIDNDDSLKHARRQNNEDYLKVRAAGRTRNLKAFRRRNLHKLNHAILDDKNVCTYKGYRFWRSRTCKSVIEECSSRHDCYFKLTFLIFKILLLLTICIGAICVLFSTNLICRCPNKSRKRAPSWSIRSMVISILLTSYGLFYAFFYLTNIIMPLIREKIMLVGSESFEDLILKDNSSGMLLDMSKDYYTLPDILEFCNAYVDCFLLLIVLLFAAAILSISKGHSPASAGCLANSSGEFSSKDSNFSALVVRSNDGKCHVFHLPRHCTVREAAIRVLNVYHEVYPLPNPTGGALEMAAANLLFNAPDQAGEKCAGSNTRADPNSKDNNSRVVIVPFYATAKVNDDDNIINSMTPPVAAFRKSKMVKGGSASDIILPLNNSPFQPNFDNNNNNNNQFIDFSDPPRPPPNSTKFKKPVFEEKSREDKPSYTAVMRKVGEIKVTNGGGMPGVGGGLNKRFHDEEDYELKVRRRRSRLISSAEQAFETFGRIHEDTLRETKRHSIVELLQSPHNGGGTERLITQHLLSDFEGNDGKGKMILKVEEMAQAIFPSLVKHLHKFLRLTKQQSYFGISAILEHLARIIKYDMGVYAFLERYLNPVNPIHNDKTYEYEQDWIIISDTPLNCNISDGSFFQLRYKSRSADSRNKRNQKRKINSTTTVKLLVEIRILPKYNLHEHILNPKLDKFEYRCESSSRIIV